MAWLFLAVACAGGSEGTATSGASDSGTGDTCESLSPPGFCRSAPLTLADLDAGIGGFRVDVAWESPTGRAAVIPLGDVNGDGLDDLSIADFVVFSQPETAWLSDDPEVLAPRGFQIVAPCGALEPRAAGDVNGDDFADLLVFDCEREEPRGWVVFGKGDVDDVDVGDLSAGIGGYAILGALGSRAPRPLGDIDGDGFDDLALALDGAGVVVIAGKADGELVDLAAVTPIASFAAADIVTAGDLDGDGVVDLGLAKTYASAKLLSAPDGWSSPARQMTPVNGTYESQFELRDLDADGFDDLLLTMSVSAATAGFAGQLLYGPLELGDAPLGDANQFNVSTELDAPTFIDADGTPGAEVIALRRRTVDEQWLWDSTVLKLASFAPKDSDNVAMSCSHVGDVLVVESRLDSSELGDVDGDGREDLMLGDHVVTAACD